MLSRVIPLSIDGAVTAQPTSEALVQWFLTIFWVMCDVFLRLMGTIDFYLEWERGKRMNRNIKIEKSTELQMRP